MLFAKGPNGLVATARPSAQAQQVRRPVQGPARPAQDQVPDDGSTAHLRARLAAVESQNAGLNQRLGKLEMAFGRLLQKLANRAQPQTPTGARVPEVVERGGAAAGPSQEDPRAQRSQRARDFDQEIEDAISMSGGDDDELQFG